MKVSQLRIAIVAAMSAIAIIGCGVTYGDVAEPPASGYSPMMFGEDSPDKAYIPSTFVAFFNSEMRQNEFRVEDWPGTEVFRFRLPDVEVGDGTVTYKSSKVFPPDNRKSLKVGCSLADAAESRDINNGDMVDVEGIVKKAERGQFRIVVDLKPCHLIKYEN